MKTTIAFITLAFGCAVFLSFFVIANQADQSVKVEVVEDSQVYWQNHHASEQCAGQSHARMLGIEVTARTGSMRPTFDAGHTLLIVDYNSSRGLVEGDIVAVRQEGKAVIHRVVAVSDQHEYFLLKGDNTARPDSVRWEYDSLLYVVCGVLYT